MIYSPGTALTLSDGARAHPCPPRKKTLKVVFIYIPGTTLTLSMAPAHIPGPPEQNPKSSFDLYPRHRTNPEHGARAKPCPFRKKTLKVVSIYTRGTALTLSMAPARIPGPPNVKP